MAGNYTRTEEHRKKMSEKLKGRSCFWLKGKKRPPRSKEWCKKISLAKKNNKECQGNFGIWATKDRPYLAVDNNGKKNPNWKGGITLLIQQIRHNLKYRQWRSDVFTRDNFTCQECEDNTGGNLEAHHKKSFSSILQYYEITTLEEALECEELWNINNGMTLCEDCHKKIHRYADCTGYKQFPKNLNNYFTK